MSPSEAPSKQCFKCRQFRPLVDFYKHSQMADGHLNKCKFCTRIDTKINRAERSDYYRQYDHERNKQPHRRKLNAQKREAYRKAHPERQATYCKVYRAKKRGILQVPARCPHCGSDETPIHAHHEDYSKPFQVTWLCPRCHHAHHHIRNYFTGEFL